MNQYFAQVTDGVVTDVAVVSASFMAANPDRYQGTWVETFLETQKTYAGIGFMYDPATQDFFDPTPPIEE